MNTLKSRVGVASTGILAAALAAPLTGQTFRSVDFEDYPVGPGELEGPFDGVGFFNVTGNAFTDPIQGVAPSSPIGTGKAGYIGGPSQASGSIALNFVHFPGNFNDARYLVSGTPKALVAKSIDFSITRAAKSIPQDYYFYSVSFSSEMGDGFSAHAMVMLGSDNMLRIRDNWLAVYEDTGFSVLPDNPYRLSYTLDYEQELWSATITDLSDGEEVILADSRMLETGSFILGDYHKVEELNVELFALPYDIADGQTGDVLFIDNFISAAIPEPASFAGLMGFVSAGFILLRRRR